MTEEVPFLPHSLISSFPFLSADCSDNESDGGCTTVEPLNNELSRNASSAIGSHCAGRKSIGGVIFNSVDELGVEMMNPSLFRDTYRMRRPVIIKAGASSWSACSLWVDPDAFIARVTPNCGFTLASKDNKNFLLHELCDVSRVTLHDALREIMSASNSTQYEGCKLYSRMYLHDHPHLHEDVNLTQISDYMNALVSSDSKKADVKLSNCGVWASSQGCVTPLHYDICHGFLCQIVGRKTFLLGAPMDTNYMYRNTSIASKNQTSSRVDLSLWLEGDVAERKRFPNISEVTWCIAELNPGDVLYTPPGWWHHVTSVDASISVLVPFDPATTEALCVLQSV